MTESSFNVNDKVFVQLPGRPESYYGVITHICTRYTPLLTIQVKSKLVAGLAEPYEKEFRLSETRPAMVWKTEFEGE